jgi:RNA recognition motif-containing protein
LKTIFVGNLGSDVTRENLQSLFAAHGEIIGVDVVDGQDFGYVRMIDDSEAYRAIKALNGRLCCGQELNVSVAKAYSHRKRDTPLAPASELAVA